MKRPALVGQAISADETGLQHGFYGDYVISSAFQPIYARVDALNLEIQGYEGLMRPVAHDAPCPPLVFLNSIDNSDRLFVESMSNALHIRNFKHVVPDNRDLFLNINPAAYTSPDIVNREIGISIERLPRHGIKLNQMVFEILETKAFSPAVLRELSDVFFDNNVRIAMDDYGTGESDFERYKLLRPHIVKMDKAFVSESRSDPSKFKYFKYLVDRFQDEGTKVLIEGLETASDLQMALATGADFLQGYLLGYPTKLPHRFNPYFSLNAEDLGLVDCA